MKLVFREYLASLRERAELDAVLPDLLSELGYTVLSRPTTGTRQYGVDVAALSPAVKGKRKLYLFSLKRGDLTRADWDGTPQALRSSINEILDVYIPTWIPPELKKRDVVICLCFGGIVQEAVRQQLSLFIDRKTAPGLSFEEWNGDYLAELLVQGVLREQLVSPQLRSSFQKAVAMVDEPDIAFDHFAQLIRGLCDAPSSTARQRLTRLRQLIICLWVLFVWARDSGNLEAPYRASERAILFAWQMVRADLGRSSRVSEDIGENFAELVSLHFAIWDALLGDKILPYVGVEHAVSVAVRSSAAVDVNLKLFETLGRLAVRGLWMLWEKGRTPLPELRSDWDSKEAEQLAYQIVELIRHNGILFSPITDAQAVDIAAALLFLSMMDASAAGASSYCEGILKLVTFAYRTHSRYPTIRGDYRSLVHHPEATDEYREANTKGSTLIPLLSMFATAFGLTEGATFLAGFVEKHMKHCNMQFWAPGRDSEDKMYVGEAPHGLALNNIPITSDGSQAFKMVRNECTATSPFEGLSAIKLEHWPIVVLACRHYRWPLPPNLWIDLIEQLRAKYVSPPAVSHEKMKAPAKAAKKGPAATAVKTRKASTKAPAAKPAKSRKSVVRGPRRRS